MFHSRTAHSGQHSKDGKRMHGRGIFTFANGNKYVGTFHDGAFHGRGIIFFTAGNGGGQFRGEWVDGKSTSGEYIFSDGLRYEEVDWGHCTLDDRRLWHETLAFIQPPTTGEGAVVPDYSTSDGMPPAFADGMPRGAMDVTDAYWQMAPPPQPEHEGKVGPEDTHDVALAIAEACGGHRS